MHCIKRQQPPMTGRLMSAARTAAAQPRPDARQATTPGPSYWMGSDLRCRWLDTSNRPGALSKGANPLAESLSEVASYQLPSA